MTVFVCLDDRGGMAFDGRRQSRDSQVVEDIFATVGNGSLYAAPYTEKMLSEYRKSARVKVRRDPLGALGAELVFIEDCLVEKHIKKIDTFIIYKWNTLYPSDLKFDISPLECGFRLVSTSEFAGSSHEKITKEIYKR